MGGLEPPSKQRPKELSTRLFFLCLSGEACRKTGELILILWGLARFKGVPACIRFEWNPWAPA